MTADDQGESQFREVATDYLQSLRPADDLLMDDEYVDSGELDALRSLTGPGDDLDATARLPMIDVHSLPDDVRANLGESGICEEVA